jgi:hypothetical protein
MAREMADKEHNLLDKLVHSALFADSIGGHGFRNEQDLTDAEGPSARLGGARRDLGARRYVHVSSPRCPVEHRPKMSLYGRPLKLLELASGCPFEPRETESRSTDETKRTPVVRTRGRGRRW